MTAVSALARPTERQADAGYTALAVAEGTPMLAASYGPRAERPWS
jgi:hypothetical protein